MLSWVYLRSLAQNCVFFLGKFKTHYTQTWFMSVWSLFIDHHCSWSCQFDHMLSWVCLQSLTQNWVFFLGKFKTHYTQTWFMSVWSLFYVQDKEHIEHYTHSAPSIINMYIIIFFLLCWFSKSNVKELHYGYKEYKGCKKDLEKWNRAHSLGK